MGLQIFCVTHILGGGYVYGYILWHVGWLVFVHANSKTDTPFLGGGVCFVSAFESIESLRTAFY